MSNRSLGGADVEFGIQVGGDFSTVLDAARFAEEQGVAAVAVFDHYLMSEDSSRAATRAAFDAFVHLGALARETASVELVVLVTPVTFRHPAVLAKAAVTLDHLSNGRFKLGVGSGWFEREHALFGIPFPDAAERFQHLEDALGYLTAAFNPAWPGFTGRFYHLESFPLAPLPLSKIPLLVGGSGARRTPRLAGAYADECDLIELQLDDVPTRIARMRAAAVEAGRDPDDIMLSYNSPVLAFDTEDELNGYVSTRAKATGQPMEDFAERIAGTASAVGSWQQIHHKLAAMEELGIQRYYIGFWDAVWDRAATQRFLEHVR